MFGFGCSSTESNHASYARFSVSRSLGMGFTFTHATMKLLTAGAIASWFSFGMRLLKSSVGTTRTTQLIGHAISEHVRTIGPWRIRRESMYGPVSFSCGFNGGADSHGKLKQFFRPFDKTTSSGNLKG